MDLQDLTEFYLKSHEAAQLATQMDGQPRLCSIHYAYDTGFNLYWRSLRSAHHSEALRRNCKTAVGILHDDVKKQCLHMEGESFELDGAEADKAHDVYAGRYGESTKKVIKTDAGADEQSAIYVFRPERFILIDAVNFPDSPRQEWTA